MIHGSVVGSMLDLRRDHDHHSPTAKCYAERRNASKMHLETNKNGHNMIPFLILEKNISFMTLTILMLLA